MYRLLTTNNAKIDYIKFFNANKSECISLRCLKDGHKSFSMFRHLNWLETTLLDSIHTKSATISNFRIQSTTPNAGILVMPQPKRKRSNQKFTELLQINNGSYTETKAAVQKLKSKKLSNFIDKIDGQRFNEHKSNEMVEYQIDAIGKYDDSSVILVGNSSLKLPNGIEQLQEIIQSYRQFREMTTVEEDAELVMEQPVDFLNPRLYEHEHEEEECFEGDHTEELAELTIPINVRSKSKSKSSKSNNSTLRSFFTIDKEIAAKRKGMLSNLASFTELSVTSNTYNRGIATLLNTRYKFKQFKWSPIPIDIFNIMLSGLAERGNFNKCREILKVIQEDKIALNAQSYASIIECLERTSTDSCNNENQIIKSIQDAISQGISLNDIMDKSIFTNDKREIVLNGLKRFDSNFQPIYSKPILTYDNELINSLNDNVKEINKIENITNHHVKGSKILTPKSGFTKEQLQLFAKEQIKMEMDTNITIKSIQHFPTCDSTVLTYRTKLSDLKKQWHNQIRSAFLRDINSLKSQLTSQGIRSVNILPYMKAMDVEIYIDILLKEIQVLIEGSDTFSLTVSFLYKLLGQRVQSRYYMERKKHNGVQEKTEQVYDKYCENMCNFNTTDNSRQNWQRLLYQMRDSGASMDIKDNSWSNPIQTAIGRFLYQILMRDVKVDLNILRPNSQLENKMPAFYTLFRNEGRFIREEIKPHPILTRLQRGSQQETLTFPSNQVPMLCPPQPWSTPYNGGYLLAQSNLIRLPHQAYQQWDRINATNPVHMYPSLDSLNQLGSIPWRVNTELLDVAMSIFNAGGNSKLDVPQPPSSLPPLEIPSDNLTKKQKFQIHREKLVHRRRQGEMYGLWCDALYRLSLANHYRDKVFWLPHNMDFRGRVYPIPPHLNHLGSDLARSLLIFNQKQPLGPNGFRWLKLHCINLTGLKKRESIEDRLKFADECMDDMLDSADNPLSGKQWWTKSDEPWQTLGVCMEIAKVHRSPNPELFMSSLPIHQDGSCNGLQHYAALGRDTIGAIKVNLAASEIPQDVYTAVAELIEKNRVKDAEDGGEIAKILNGFIRRKVIKQTVMTTVYGVTRYGARLQIAKQLKNIDDFPQESVWRASNYLTAKTFDSLREMFTSTKEIQDWFTHCAKLISTIGGHNVEWITPLGLPVVQPYNRYDKILLPKSNRIGDTFMMDMHSKPNSMKQKNAFPPNFIHSLDSTHMMLTSLHCEKAGLTFVSVHDCYWTHACNVAKMNEICREQFVALHSQPILENLSKYLVQRYSYNEKDFINNGSTLESTKKRLNKILKLIPKKGDFDLKNVLESVYFFS